MGETGLTDGATPRVGVVGAGQLARMMQQAAISLGIELHLLAGAPDEAAARVTPHVRIGRPDSPDDLRAFAAECHVVTFDHELVDVAALRALEAAGHAVYPSAGTVAVAQDKGRQRRLFNDLGLPVPPFARVHSVEEIRAFAARHEWPVVLKAERGGYDGRGVWIARRPDAGEPEDVIEASQRGGFQLMAEQYVPIERELAQLVARRPSGELVAYPLVETVQREGICHEVLTPAAVSPALADEARRIAFAIAEAIDLAGIMAVELFETGGRLLINEIACRPHNSGHFSIEACATSQFENHLRAVLDWPLGSPALVAPAAAMVNLIGVPGMPRNPMENLPAALGVEGVRIHLYGKDARPGRKVGHATALAESTDAARQRAAQAVALLEGATTKE
ncbi:MAG TPA: 5-(carboxyamino)imidazole ribonucleotide synthase [Dehalococcoidia bacterium]|nr:5-(carboxyamino)imidazole ribonucleotide synthase [Dehalococcoidia bacterium]